MYECHGHIMMDGSDFSRAKSIHQNGADKETVKQELQSLADAGVIYFRDGGDAYSVSAFAKVIARDYGIKYVTPLFAIHKTGHYGSIVGRGYSDINEYQKLVEKARTEGGDFIKVMVSGIITFRKYAELSCGSLSAEEIKDLVNIAHDKGLPVMIHANGDEAVRASILAGADSIEHGAFMSDDTIEMLAESETVWVPTAAAIAAFTDRCNIPGIDRQVARNTLERHLRSIGIAAEKGALIAAGSDSGAVGVPHGSGTCEEYRLLKTAGVPDRIRDRGNEKIGSVFDIRAFEENGI